MLITTNELREIENTLAERLKVDYSNFSDDFFRRRLAYVFDKMHFHRVQDLYAALGSLVTFDEITYYLSVPQTELFRSPCFWRRMLKALSESSDIKTIWLPCLTSYHELFNLAIVLDIAGRTDCQVTVNVLSDKTTAESRSLRVSKHDDAQNRSNFERLECSKSYDDYVVKTADGVSLRPGLIDNVTFRNGWFVGYPDEKYDAVICRDVMLTYNEQLERQSVAKLVGSLSGPGAVLGLGTMERPLGMEKRMDDTFASDGFYSLMRCE